MTWYEIVIYSPLYCIAVLLGSYMGSYLGGLIWNFYEYLLNRH